MRGEDGDYAALVPSSTWLVELSAKSSPTGDASENVSRDFQSRFAWYAIRQLA